MQTMRQAWHSHSIQPMHPTLLVAMPPVWRDRMIHVLGALQWLGAAMIVTGIRIGRR